MANCRRITALLLLLLFIFNCGAQAASTEEAIVLPEPAPQDARMILGESCAQDTREVTLYFVTDGSSNLTSASREIQLQKGKTLVESAVNELLNARFTSGIQSVGSGLQLTGLEYACGIATVNLSINAGTQHNDLSELLRCTAIANTLLGIEGVEAVNVLTGSRSDAICSLPMGVFTAQTDSVAALYAQMQTERGSFLSAPFESLTRDVLIYYPSTNGYFLPEIRKLSFSEEASYIDALLEALKAAPTGAAQCFSPIPAAEEFLASPAVLRVNEAGERIAELNLSAMVPNYLAFSGMEPWQLYGSIVLTLTSYIPELDAVQISIDGSPVSELNIGERRLKFSGSLMRRSDFAEFIGSNAALYFANEQGGLTRTACAMSQSSASTPRALLTTMVSTPAPAGCSRVFPAEIFPEDILGVHVDERIATVNLSGNFYTRCQSLDAAQERILIYAMVNSLCELPGIGAVQFLVEGMTLESLSRNIYLKTALLPDPGITG